MEMLQEQIPAEARPWVEWVLEASQAMQRVAAKCWSGVPRDIRRALLDFGDLLPPAMHSYFADLRQDEPGRPALRFDGLDSAPVRASLSALYEEVRGTMIALKARDAVTDLVRRRPDLTSELVSTRDRVLPGARQIRAGEKGEEAFARARSSVLGAYSATPEVDDVVRPLRAYNKLVHRIIGVLLGLAELPEPVRITDALGAVADHLVDGGRHLDLTVRHEGAPLLRPTHPVWIDFKSPLDGLYVVQRHTLAFAGGEEDDLGLVALE